MVKGQSDLTRIRRGGKFDCVLYQPIGVNFIRIDNYNARGVRRELVDAIALIALVLERPRIVPKQFITGSITGNLIQLMVSVGTLYVGMIAVRTVTAGVVYDVVLVYVVDDASDSVTEIARTI
jgi:hypothetical protein